jgi:hypothetical protein
MDGYMFCWPGFDAKIALLCFLFVDAETILKFIQKGVKERWEEDGFVDRSNCRLSNGRSLYPRDTPKRLSLMRIGVDSI